MTLQFVWTGQHDTEASLQLCCRVILSNLNRCFDQTGYSPIAGPACLEAFSSLPELTRCLLWTDDPASQFYSNISW